MSNFCPNCKNFLVLEDEGGIPTVQCTVCSYKGTHDGVTVVATFPGASSHSMQAADDAGTVRTLENLTYEKSMSTAKDVKCPKGHTDVIVMFDNRDRYRYMCRECKKEIKV